MKECALAKNFQDIGRAISIIQPVVEFHDMCLIFTDAEHDIVANYFKPSEKKVFQDMPSMKGCIKPNTIAGNPSIFSNYDIEAREKLSFTESPWSFGLYLGFPNLETHNRRPKAIKAAHLLLYRHELIPFTENDLWLLEMSHGPIMLALEKVLPLQAIEKASKEWRITFDAISEPITVVDEEYSIQKANRAFAQLVAGDIKKIKGKKCH